MASAQIAPREVGARFARVEQAFYPEASRGTAYFLLNFTDVAEVKTKQAVLQKEHDGSRVAAVEPIAESADQQHWERAHDECHSQIDAGCFRITGHAGRACPARRGKERCNPCGEDQPTSGFDSVRHRGRIDSHKYTRK